MTSKRLSVRVDGDLSDDLKTLSDAGYSASEAVRVAVAVLADAHRGAWSAGATQGARVDVVACTVELCPTPVQEAA